MLVLEAERAAAAPAPRTAAAPARAAPAAAPPQRRAAAGGGGGPVEVLVPDIGDFDEVAVIEVFVKPGDTIKVEQSLITVESDKASMEIPSSHAGVVKELMVKSATRCQGHAGGRAAGGGARLRRAGAARPLPLRRGAALRRAACRGAGRRAGARADGAQGALPHASPSIRRLARELGVPLAEVKGSGPKGRITQDDVQGFVKGVMAGACRPPRRRPRRRPPRPPPAAPSRACWPGRRSTSPSSARSSART